MVLSLLAAVVALAPSLVTCFQSPEAPTRRHAQMSASFGDFATHLVALDFDLDGVKSSISSSVDLSGLDAAKSSVSALTDSIDAAKSSALEAKDNAIGSALEAKDNAVGSVLAPLKSAQDSNATTLPPLPEGVSVPKLPEGVSVPKLPSGLALPKLPDGGGDGGSNGPFAEVRSAARAAGVGAAVGGAVGARLGWAARGWAQAASDAKDNVAKTFDKAKDTIASSGGK